MSAWDLTFWTGNDYGVFAFTVLAFIAFCVAGYSGPEIAPDATDDERRAIDRRQVRFGLALAVVAFLLCYFSANQIKSTWWYRHDYRGSSGQN